MSMPFDNHEPQSPADDGLIDRLVDGELPDNERRELLLRLDTAPAGWRRCALAFLEAQSWCAAFGQLAVTYRPAGSQVVALENRDAKRNTRLSVARLTALAAGIAAAFTLGWVLHGKQVETAPGAVMANAEKLAPATTPEPLQAPPAGRDGSGTPASRWVQPAQPPTLLDPLVKQFEQRGYRAERQKRLISLELKDGRRLDVPVQEVRLQYIGDRTY